MDKRMATTTQKKRWHIDQINEASTAEDQLMRAFNYARAVFAQYDQERPRDAAGYRRNLAALITTFTSCTSRARPEEKYREAWPPLPGGSDGHRIAQRRPR